MITVSAINSKKINDPVFLSARKFMVDRIAMLEAQGPSNELTLAKQRYDGLRHEDVMIEPPVKFTTGKVRCCFLSRKTGFFRADIDVEIVPVKAIFEEFAVAVTTYGTVDELVLAVKNGVQTEGVVFINLLGKHAIVVPAAKANPDDVMKVMKDIYWDEIKTDTKPAMDPASKESGSFTISAINIDKFTGPLYFIEDLKAIV